MHPVLDSVHTNEIILQFSHDPRALSLLTMVSQSKQKVHVQL